MRVLALDLGTSSVRGLVLDERTLPVPGALARRKPAMTVGDDGTAVFDGPTYLGALIECVDELAQAGHLAEVGLVTASAQWHSVVPLDAVGGPLGPVLTWLDTRSAALRSARRPADDAAFHQRTGTWWHPFYWTVRLPWLRQYLGTTPARFAGLAEYIYGVLLDEARISVSQASGTGLLDLRALDWDAEACDLAGVRPHDLPVLAPDGWRGQLRAQYARRWPTLSRAAWAPPLGDGAASNIGSRCVDARRAAVTVGTSAAVRVIQPAPAKAELPPLPYKLWRYRVDERRVITGAAHSAGGNLYKWANRVLRLPEGEALSVALAAIPPGGGDVGADPRLGGDRPPGLAPVGSGKLSGIGFRTSAVDIFAGLMDAVCRQIAIDLAELEAAVGHRLEVVVGGGAVAASAWWRRAFEVALSPRPVFHVENPEIGAIGAALAAVGRLDEDR
jgi:gluconokinase